MNNNYSGQFTSLLGSRVALRSRSAQVATIGIASIPQVCEIHKIRPLEMSIWRINHSIGN